MSCSSCNNNTPSPVLNQTCGINVESTWITNSDLVQYTGDNLSCIGVNTNDTLTVALQNINTSVCPENIAMVLLDTIQSNPQYLTTFANFVNQTIINCTTTTTSTSSTTTSTSSTSTTSTTSTTTTSACHLTTTTTTSILKSICLGYSAADCTIACTSQCSTYYVTIACSTNLTAGCQIYTDQNFTPAPAGYYSYNGNCYTVGAQGIISVEAICTYTTSSTTTTSTTVRIPFNLCYVPLSGGSCETACTSCFTTSTTSSTTTHAPGAIEFLGICGPIPASNYQTAGTLDCCSGAIGGGGGTSA